MWCLLKLKEHQNQFSAGALSRTPLGELTTLPTPRSRLGRGTPPRRSFPPRRLRCLDLAAFSTSLLTSFSSANSQTASL